MTFRIFKNPVAQKRFLRFKSLKRAYLSLWILLVLYGLSLVSELLCNNVPLYIRYNGNAYFPVIKYYSEDEFTGSGRQTRPDYRDLVQSKKFQEDPDNFMIFPPFPYDPLESVKPESILVSDDVTLRLSPVSRIGTVDIDCNFTVVRVHLFDYFAGRQQKQDIIGENLGTFFVLPDKFEQAIARRFNNQGAPYQVFTIKNQRGVRSQVSLSTFHQRPETPEKLRLMFKEITATGKASVSIRFNRSLHPVSSESGIWEQIFPEDRQLLLHFIKNRFERPVDNYRVTIKDRQYTASFDKEDVRFPFPPVKDHPLGIDGAGRDVLARILYGLRISLTFGLLLVGCSMLLGVMAGAVQGYYGGKLDITAQRMIEVWSALPFLYIMILMGSIYGRSFSLLLICYGVFNWVGISYYIRAEFLNLRKRPFVEAAKCMGVPSYKIIFRHILPNALVPVITFFPFSLVGAIGALAALDYLGFGLPPPTPSWGELLFQAQQYRWAWWLILYPSLALFAVMLLGVFVGEGIRNAYDPKQFSRLH
ncbi:MAG: ABC transporter permease subunit [Dissulfuribacterales bacterium]